MVQTVGATDMDECTMHCNVPMHAIFQMRPEGSEIECSWQRRLAPSASSCVAWSAERSIPIAAA